MNILIIENNETEKTRLKNLFFNACKECKECKVEAVEFGYHGLTLTEEFKPTVIILNKTLPDVDGIEILKYIRKSPDKYGNPYIIFIMSNTDESIVTECYLSGANDVIAYPFSSMVLMNKMKNLGKCLLIKKIDILSDSSTYLFNELEINDSIKRVYYSGNEVRLEKKEYDLLIYLIKNKNKAVKREEIMESVWGSNYIGITDRAVDSCICKLKSKIPMLSECIERVFKFGYCLKY